MVVICVCRLSTLQPVNASLFLRLRMQRREATRKADNFHRAFRDTAIADSPLAEWQRTREYRKDR